jgi:polyhydroxyalkanoate synthase subunit PhaC
MEASTSNDRLDSIRREAQRSLFRARNGIQLVTGMRQPTIGATPAEVVWRRGKARLIRYRSDQRTRHPPLVIVWSVVSQSYILDLRPGHSFIEQLLGEGIDVFMLDWGVADNVDAGNGLELYVDNYMPRALERALEVSDSDELDLLGYCFGGVLSALATAGYPDFPVNALGVMAAPFDLRPVEGLIKLFRKGSLKVEDMFDENGNVPADAVYRGFASLRPTTDIFKYATLWERLWNDEFVEGYQAMAAWIRDQTPLPGALAAQLVDWFVRDNQLVTGELELSGRTIYLADIVCPVLNVMAEHDHMVPPSASRIFSELVGATDVTDLLIPAGHIGLAAGRDAKRKTVPRIVEWLNAHSS